jgi:hypothetical protein
MHLVLKSVVLTFLLKINNCLTGTGVKTRNSQGDSLIGPKRGHRIYILDFLFISA